MKKRSDTQYEMKLIVKYHNITNTQIITAKPKKSYLIKLLMLHETSSYSTTDNNQ